MKEGAYDYVWPAGWPATRVNLVWDGNFMWVDRGPGTLPTRLRDMPADATFTPVAP